MKKTFVLFLLLSFCFLFSLNAQVFNTGQTLKKGTLAVELNPHFIHVGDNTYKFGTYAGLGIGLKSGTDLRLRYGWLNERHYFGADLEFALLSSSPYISLTLGGHLIEHDPFAPGADATLNITIPVSGNFDIYGAVDIDVDLYKYKTKDDENEYKLIERFWIPLGFEYRTGSLGFIGEVDIPVGDDANLIIGGGMVIYL